MELVDDIYLFDVDGTLTPPRQKMTEEFYSFFKDWIVDKKVYFVSGSDYEKLEEQIPQDILQSVSGVFGCMGNTFHVGGHNINCRVFEPSEALLCYLEECLNQSEYALRTGNHIERRIGMINFSVVGRNASHAARNAYYEYDQEKNERLKYAREINENFEELEAAIGGEISIDIYPQGWDKSQVLKNIPKGNYFFFGDRTLPGGNDFSLAKALTDSGHTVYNVSGYKDTWKIICS